MSQFTISQAEKDVLLNLVNGRLPGVATAPFDDATALIRGSADVTKLVRIEVDGLTPGITRVLTMPDTDITPDDASATRGHAVLAGQAGGQTLIGGTDASEDLILRTTTNPTKGDVLIADDGGRVGIGTSTPSEQLHVAGNTRIDGNLIVEGTTITTESETVLIADNHLYLNDGYTIAAAQTGGLVVNYLPTATTDTVAAGGFTAGIAAVSNPTVATVGDATFTVGDLVQVSGSDNDGLYEVLTHAANVLTIRGIGTTGTVEDFTQDQFVTDAVVAGTITKINVAVQRAGIDGLWEVASGSSTGFSFADLVSTQTVAGGGLSGTYPDPSVNGFTAGVLTDDAAHGVRGGGTQHADVVAAGASGFMTGADKTNLDDVVAGALANIVEDTTPQLGGDLDALQKDISNVSELRFDVQGASQGILYKDVGGGFRSALIFPGSDLVVISNRASNGSVQVRANNVAAGVAGEQLVAVFAADRAILIQPTLIGAGGPQDTSSQLEVISTTKGFLPPRMTATQRDAITSPASGLSVYDATNNALNYFNGTEWRSLLNTLAATLAVGSIPFATGAAEVDDDNANLFWDNINKQLGVGTNAPVANCIMEMKSTTKGFLPPRWTAAQEATNIATLGVGDAGLMWRNITTKKVKTWDGASVDSLANEADVVTVVNESFAATNARFFGELGLPASQGWTDTATGSATIDLLNESVFGVTKQVVRHNDDAADGSIITKLALTAQNWTDINAFGASYSGISRLDTINGASGFFSGLQANAAENPLATGNRRYGINFKDNAGNLQVSDADAGGSTVTFDGTGGNPQIDFDEYVAWECVVPAGLGAAQFYVNGVLSTFAPLFLVNAGGLGTLVLVGSGSTSGVNRVAYHSNFGVTIYEEASTKTLAAATMTADVAQVFIPPGKRDYTVVLPDGNPRPVSAKLDVVANNLLGQLILVTQDQAIPEALFNGLRKLTLDIAFKEVVSGINTVSSSNVYIGFNVSESPTLAQLSSNVDQIPVDTNPTVITFNTQDEISGITHSVSTNPGEITIVKPGLYSLLVQPQVGKDSGATKVDMNVFIQRDDGSGFKDVPNSNVILSIKDQDITDVVVVGEAHVYQVGEKLRFMQKVSETGSGIGLRATAAQVGPPTVPATPSIILKMKKNTGRA